MGAMTDRIYWQWVAQNKSRSRPITGPAQRPQKPVGGPSKVSSRGSSDPALSRPMRPPVDSRVEWSGQTLGDPARPVKPLSSASD